LRPIGQLAAHIIGARARWFRNFLDEGGTQLDSLTVYGGPNQPIPAATFTRTYRGEMATLSRRWVVWHLLEHDLHHGGELLLTLAVHRWPTPDI
jgi:uncharacterized damage-inducible protein DinB